MAISTPRGFFRSHGADQSSVLKTHLKFPSKVHGLARFSYTNSLLRSPKDEQAQDSAHALLPFLGRGALAVSSALTNRLLALCVGKMSLFAVERMVNLHLNEHFFLEGIFHCETKKFFSLVDCPEPTSPWQQPCTHGARQGSPALTQGNGGSPKSNRRS